MKNEKPGLLNFLLTILILQAISFIVVLLNIPIARQLIGFVYFTFIPGMCIIKLFKMKVKDLTETVLLAVGISIAFLMIIGLIMNEVHSLFAVQNPFSLAFLLPIINSFILIFAVIAYLRKGDNESINLSLKESLVAIPLFCIPVLGIIGAMTSRIDNTLLFLMIIAIALIFAVTTISRKAVFAKLYPFIIFIIAISLMYHSALVSDELIHFGSDTPGEVFVQKVVEKDAYWNSAGKYPGDQTVGRTYAMLSVTLLPTMYSVLLNLDSILIFKLFYLMLFALVPLGLFNLWKDFMDEKFAFISAFFFMSFQPFYNELLGLNKQMLGELFLVLLLAVLLNKRRDKTNKVICTILFSFGLVVSHYALAEIFLFFILFALTILVVTKKSSRNISPTFVLYFFVIMFMWYIFTSGSSVYDSFLTFGQRVYNELDDFFNPQSREPEVLRGLGLEPPPTIWNLISRIFAYITEAFIVIGFISTTLKRTKIHLNKDYFVLTVVAMFFLGALIVVPGLSSTMRITRFYHVLLFIIAPLCAIGAENIIRFSFKKGVSFKTFSLLIIVLVPYFLFQTGFIYELTNSPSWSLPLTVHRLSQAELYRKFGYIDAYYVSASKWLSESSNITSPCVYADDYARRTELRAYAVVYMGYVRVLSNTTQLRSGDIIYLNPSNIIDGRVVGQRYVWNVSSLQFLYDANKVYSNGRSEIYKNIP
jgi:uncharacterized membrane protein